REDDPGAAELEEFRRRILGLAVDVDRRAQLASEWFLIFAAGDADGVKTHLRGILDAEMAESAQPQHGDDIAGPGPAVPQCIERGETRTHQRRRVTGRQLGGHECDGTGGGDHVLGVAAVVGDARNLAADAGEELTAATVVAIAAIAPVPADAHQLAW